MSRGKQEMRVNFFSSRNVQGESEKTKFFDFQKQPEGIQKK